MTDAAFPKDYHALLALCETQHSRLSHLERFVASLLEQIRLSRHQHFGARSEAFNVDQLSLFSHENSASDSNTDRQAVDSAQETQEEMDDSMVAAAHRRK